MNSIKGQIWLPLYPHSVTGSLLRLGSLLGIGSLLRVLIVLASSSIQQISEFLIISQNNLIIYSWYQFSLWVVFTPKKEIHQKRERERESHIHVNVASPSSCDDREIKFGCTNTNKFAYQVTVAGAELAKFFKQIVDIFLAGRIVNLLN